MYIRGMYELPIVESTTEISLMLGFSAIFIAISMILIKVRGSELAC